MEGDALRCIQVISCYRIIVSLVNSFKIYSVLDVDADKQIVVAWLLFLPDNV